MRLHILAALFITCAAHGAEQRIDCPARYPAHDIVLPETGPWETGLVPEGLRLAGGGMFTGALAHRAELRGSEQPKNGGSRVHFGFNGAQDREDKWFVCYYGQGGSVHLARRVAAATTSCMLTHKENTFPQRPEVRLVCK